MDAHGAFEYVKATLLQVSGGDVADVTGEATPSAPRGKWAQSMESMEHGGPLVIKSVLSSDPIVLLPRLNKSKSEGAVNVVVNVSCILRTLRKLLGI